MRPPLRWKPWHPVPASDRRRQKLRRPAGRLPPTLPLIHQPRRRGRRPSRRGTAEPARPAAYQLPTDGADVILVGFFSGKQTDYETVMAAAAARRAADGGRVVARPPPP